MRDSQHHAGEVRSTGVRVTQCQIERFTASNLTNSQHQIERFTAPDVRGAKG